MPDKVIIIIVLPFDHRSFDQLNMSNHGHSLPTRGTDPSFSHKSEVSITHEQNIICSKTLICRSRGKLSANEKEGKIHRMIIIISLHFPNRKLSKDDGNGNDDARNKDLIG